MEELAPLATSISANLPRRPADRHVASERPLKMRKFNHDAEQNSEDTTPRKQDENSQPSKAVPLTDPVKSTKRYSDPTARHGPNDKIDYSIFKGKGRYGRKSDAGPSTSVNAKFVIDPARNGGRDYKFDDVVRGREERKKLHAGTCECCNEVRARQSVGILTSLMNLQYYEAVGPLPARLQAPLWRSPPKEKCRHPEDTDDASFSYRRQQEIQSHKKNISRHRYNWERPKTPPGYWNIGFPSTQEAGEINKKAERMHRQKVEEIEREAASGTGRYKRRS